MIRPLTQQLVDCLALDNMPSMACQVDFGIDGSNYKFGALQWAWKNEYTTMEELDQALGDGKKLTEIVNRGGNPYACEIVTAYDGMGPEED